MNRANILAEIRRLESVRSEHPEQAVPINKEITYLCDKLKQSDSFKPRKVV